MKAYEARIGSSGFIQVKLPAIDITLKELLNNLNDNKDNLCYCVFVESLGEAAPVQVQVKYSASTRTDFEKHPAVYGVKIYRDFDGKIIYL